MGNNKILAGRPRVTLTDLHNEWSKGTKTRRRSIQKHWPRSVRMMLKEMITRHPDSFNRPVEWEQFMERYAGEVETWWQEPFGADGVAINYNGGHFKTKVPPSEMVKQFVHMATMSASVGDGWETDATFQKERATFTCSVAYDTAWQIRHLAGEGGDRPAVYAAAGWLPNPSWTAEDFAIAGSLDVSGLNFRMANQRWFDSQGKPYNVIPLFGTEGYVADMLDGHTPYPEGVKAPVGEHGRKMVSEIVEDASGNLGMRLREQTAQEYTAEYYGARDGRTWRIGSWNDKPTVSPREFMRPFLAGTDKEYLLEFYSDLLIHYDLPLDEEEVR